MLELNEFGPSYEKELSAVKIQYSGAETLWTSNPADWIVYASHEQSITLGGWVLDAMRKVWPEVDSGIWTWPSYIIRTDE